ncbi:hypothetical protein PC9H_004503 [Pleurotus ostreatus]|uniref:F-box domain-containing protein n=1 Tax=Pleurotus ostreatus TaxID=5322 RepID=A0A8H7DTF4_PLEOS|nr:uncharacterized protein PC9H_004503 [Pleurotus ostreatus]KAF7432562.1 hypothetical protein PC9H_004503 [Pleurotus ostreatus]
MVATSSRRRRHVPNLEPELWLEIFRYATASPILAEISDYGYRPFDAVLWEERNWFEHEVSLFTKRSISTVCKYWNLLVAEFLFEDLHVRRGTNALKRALNSPTYYSSSGCGKGRWVKRVELCSSLGDFDPFRPSVLVEILRSCPRAQTLVRKFSPGGGDPLSRCRGLENDFPMLYSLRRIDWWFPSGRTPGESLGFLTDVLHHSPELRYLSLGNYVSKPSGVRMLSTDRVSLPQLSVLRLESIHPQLLSFVRQWHLPKLTHLVLDPSALAGQFSVLHIIGSRILSLELMHHPAFMEKDYISHILYECPNLQELNYHVDITQPMDTHMKTSVTSHASLQRIRIHLSSGSGSTANRHFRRRLDGRSLADHIYRHFMMISVLDAPRLEQVSLIGQWSRVNFGIMGSVDEALSKQGYGQRAWRLILAHSDSYY